MSAPAERAPLWMLREEARAVFGRLGSSQTVDGQVLQLGVALTLGYHLILAELRDPAPTRGGDRTWLDEAEGALTLVFEGLTVGVDRLAELCDEWVSSS
jgi:hypothetical protein